MRIVALVLMLASSALVAGCRQWPKHDPEVATTTVRDAPPFSRIDTHEDAARHIVEVGRYLSKGDQVPRATYVTEDCEDRARRAYSGELERLSVVACRYLESTFAEAAEPLVDPLRDLILDIDPQFEARAQQERDRARSECSEPCRSFAVQDRRGRPTFQGRWLLVDPSGARSHIVFARNGRYNGTDVCNSVSGRWERSGRDFRFVSPRMTLKGCHWISGGAQPSGFDLQSVRHWEAEDDGSQLRLYDADWRRLMTLTREPWFEPLQSQPRDLL